MTKHKKAQYEVLVHPIFNKLAEVASDAFWKGFFKGLSINSVHKGTRVTTEEKVTDGETVTVITIVISNGTKKNSKTLKLEISEDATKKELKRGVETIITHMETQSVLHSGKRNEELLRELKSEAPTALSVRRKIDREILLLNFIQTQIEDKKAVRKAFDFLINSGIVKNTNINYDDDGAIESLKDITIDDDGTVNYKDSILKEKEEIQKDRVMMSYYIEKIFPKDLI